MYKNLRSKCFIKDLWCSPKILTRCIAKHLYGEKKRREYNCRKSVGTRAGLRDSRYSRTANTVHGAGGKGTQSGKFLEVLLALFTDTSTGRVEQTSKVWTSNCCWVEDGGLGIGWLRGVGGWEGQQRKRQLEIWRPPKKTFLAGGADVIFFIHAFLLIVATSSSKSLSFTQPNQPLGYSI